MDARSGRWTRPGHGLSAQRWDGQSARLRLLVVSLSVLVWPITTESAVRGSARKAAKTGRGRAPC
ncbi:MAG: hypothetical protein ABTQ25_00270 [Nitrosomonas ureae]